MSLHTRELDEDDSFSWLIVYSTFKQEVVEGNVMSTEDAFRGTISIVESSV